MKPSTQSYRGKSPQEISQRWFFRQRGVTIGETDELGFNVT
jgi:hypothetical protein